MPCVQTYGKIADVNNLGCSAPINQIYGSVERCPPSSSRFRPSLLAYMLRVGSYDLVPEFRDRWTLEPYLRYHYSRWFHDGRMMFQMVRFLEMAQEFLVLNPRTWLPMRYNGVAVSCKPRTNVEQFLNIVWNFLFINHTSVLNYVNGVVQCSASVLPGGSILHLLPFYMMNFKHTIQRLYLWGDWIAEARTQKSKTRNFIHMYQATPCQWYRTVPCRFHGQTVRLDSESRSEITYTVLLSFLIIFRFTSAIRHLFARAWLRSGGLIKSGTSRKYDEDRAWHDRDRN